MPSFVSRYRKGVCYLISFTRFLILLFIYTDNFMRIPRLNNGVKFFQNLQRTQNYGPKLRTTEIWWPKLTISWTYLLGDLQIFFHGYFPPFFPVFLIRMACIPFPFFWVSLDQIFTYLTQSKNLEPMCYKGSVILSTSQPLGSN